MSRELLGLAAGVAIVLVGCGGSGESRPARGSLPSYLAEVEPIRLRVN